MQNIQMTNDLISDMAVIRGAILGERKSEE
jgi:hypothetical protein